MKPPKLKIIIIIAIIITLSGIIYLKENKNRVAEFAKPIGNLQTSSNIKLSSNIDTYMESQKSPYDRGVENYYCSNTLYGYDEKYAYALVYCSGFVQTTDHLEQGTSFSIPTRLEYNPKNFEITNSEQPKDGDFYDSSMKQLFPIQFYKLMNNPSNTEIKKLTTEIEEKAKSNISK